MDAVYAEVQRRFSRHISENTVCLHRGTIETLSKTSGGDEPFLDWIYIDGDHNYNSVRSDLQHAAKYVRPGGFIMGDDYTYDGWWHESVIRAVHELAASGDAKIKLVYRMQYVLVRK
jgi:predicted O-methyltransferase YrrM